MAQQTFSFQTEVKQLLHLMIHSLYSNKEIFLRELISNASDAADKLRFAAIAEPALFENDPTLKITITVDKKERTITVSDNGIGMSQEEVIQNLGTIAQSGTQAFLQSLSDDHKKDAHLIGQFGVGFYAVFMVADKVVLKTRRAGLNTGVRWESSGEGEYSVDETEKQTRGTEITLHLKAGEDDFLSDWTIKRIIQTYSDHISIPIEMAKGTSYDDDGKPIESNEMVVVNQASALWMRNKSDITTDQYKAFYQRISHDFSEPLIWSHARLEGRQSYTELLYIPSRAPFDLYHPERKNNVKLYVRRVFIMEAAQQLLPHYLRFVKGIVDSDDLPLNVSREILQESRDVEAIKSGCSKKILGLLEELAKERPEDYQSFWREFGQVLKEGIVEDSANRERIAPLLRFYSTHNDDDTANTSLVDYVSRMKPNQEKIYYITAASLSAARHSPHLEVFRQKDVEVLLLTDRIDEWVVAELTTFNDKPLQSIAKGELNLGALEDEKDKKKQQQIHQSAQPVIEKIKKTLGDKVADVRATARLTDSPACLVVGERDMSAHLERLLESVGQKSHSHAKPILEFNPKHPLVKWLAEETQNKRVKDLCWVLYEQALLTEGGKLDDPASFVAKMNALIFKKGQGALFILGTLLTDQ